MTHFCSSQPHDPITGGKDADATVERFYRFFGRVPNERWDFREGLT